MSGERDLGSYVEDMVESCERIIVFSRVMDADLLDVNSPVRAAVLHHLMILGEASKQIPADWVVPIPTFHGSA